MADDAAQPPALLPVARPLDLIPVVIKEAAFDSPTFRATAVHYGDQIDLIERWLDSYVKAVSKLSAEMAALQTMVDACISASHAPLQLSEAVLDHDYTVLALKRFGEGAREFWSGTLRGMKRAETVVCEPIRAFLQNDVRMLKDTRKALDTTQKAMDAAVARYASQAKTKEPSSLREDAFQLHEARKAYLKTSMDFSVMAPQFSAKLDKLMVKIVGEQWKDMKTAREQSTKAFAAGHADIERVRGWSKEMDNSERAFKRELHLARQQLESSAELAARPSRDLDDYTASTVPYLGKQGGSSTLHSPAKPDPANEKADKQGWLFQRTIVGKPARTTWARRWYFVKNGIFGWLIQGHRTGAVEESAKIGVLLCSIRPAFQEERRFCFEVKTKDTTILLQAETQAELTDWIAAFEVAKRKALEDTSKDTTADAAFSISLPVAPEFAAPNAEGHTSQPSDDLGMDRTDSLGVPPNEGIARASTDAVRRGTNERDGEGSRRDHAARIMEKLDLTRKSTVGPQLSGSNPSSAAGGIASLISASLASASHITGQVGQFAAPAVGLPEARIQTIPISSLAPPTLANPPVPTNLSKAAVAVSGERGIGLGRYSDMPSGLMANSWGSQNWGYISRLERGEVTAGRERDVSQPSSPIIRSPSLSAVDKPLDGSAGSAPAPTPSVVSHKKSTSLGGPASSIQRIGPNEDFPNYYPLALRMQDAQFRILFPSVPRDEKLVLVFRAVWNPTETQEFPGRVYVTTRDIYFYSNHLGLVLITSISLASIDEVTAAPGKDCDFLYLHFKPNVRKDGATRITVKTFLEPLRLLQRRLNYLVRNASTHEFDLEDVIKHLIKQEAVDSDNSPTAESWEDISLHTPMDPNEPGVYGGKNIKASLRIDGNLFGNSGRGGRHNNATKFKLPSHPVVFTPQGMTALAAEKDYDISAKGLFHILFGDKSAVFQMLYRERWAQRVVQGPWTTDEHCTQRRDFEYEVAAPASGGKTDGGDAVVIQDHQVIEVLNDHLCYIVADRKTPWYLPGADRFVLLSKLVITHVSKSRAKLAIYTKIDWKRNPRFAKSLIEKQGLHDMQLEAQDLLDVVNDQVTKLGHNRSTHKVVGIFGQIGTIGATAVQVRVEDIPPPNRPRKFVLRPQTTSQVIVQLLCSAFVGAVSRVCGWILGGFAAVGKVVSAHKILIGLLLVSATANMFYTGKESWGWWEERRAVRYMGRLGVGPGASVTMSRAVYLRDLEDAFLEGSNITSIGVEGDGEGQGGGANKCHQTFSSLLTSTSSSPAPADAVASSPGSDSASVSASSKQTSRRLHRSRQNLSIRRHDLLVALRVVNRLEQEVLKAEYENWLRDEVGLCGRMERALNEKGGKQKGADGGGGGDAEDRIRSYCRDCKGALRVVEEAVGRGLL